MRRNLTVEDMGKLLGGRTLAIPATCRADGSAMLSPVWHEWVDGNPYVDELVGQALELVRLVPGTVRAWDFRDELG